MSSRAATYGKYAGLSFDELVYADPEYVIDMYNRGGNHGISQAVYDKAVQLVEQYGEDFDPYETYDYAEAQALAFGFHYDEMEN